MTTFQSVFSPSIAWAGPSKACPTVAESRANRSLGMEELEVLRNTVLEARERGITTADLRSLRGHRWKVYLDRSVMTSRPGMTPEQAAQFAGAAHQGSCGGDGAPAGGRVVRPVGRCGAMLCLGRAREGHRCSVHVCACGRRRVPVCV